MSVVVFEREPQDCICFSSVPWKTNKIMGKFKEKLKIEKAHKPETDVASLLLSSYFLTPNSFFRPHQTLFFSLSAFFICSFLLPQIRTQSLFFFNSGELSFPTISESSISDFLLISLVFSALKIYSESFFLLCSFYRT